MPRAALREPPAVDPRHVLREDGNPARRDLEDGRDRGEEPRAPLALGDDELAHALVAGRRRPEASRPPPKLPPDGGRRAEVDDPTHARPQARIDRRGKLHPMNVPRQVCRLCAGVVLDLCQPLPDRLDRRPLHELAAQSADQADLRLRHEFQKPGDAPAWASQRLCQSVTSGGAADDRPRDPPRGRAANELVTLWHKRSCAPASGCRANRTPPLVALATAPSDSRRRSVGCEPTALAVTVCHGYELSKLRQYRLGVGPRWPWYFEPRPLEPYG